MFDEDDCINKDFGFGLTAGETKSMNKTSEYYNNVAAIGVQVGCYVEFWTGNVLKLILVLMQNCYVNSYQR